MIDPVSGLLVVAGASVGAPARFLLARLLDGRTAAVTHLGTLLVNLLGSAVLGFLATSALSGHAWALLGTGFCGTFTTFSAFAVQTYDEGWRRGTTYAVLTIAGSVLAASLGYALA